MKQLLGWALSLLFAVTAVGGGFVLSKPGKLLMKENFDGADLPELFTVGVGDWAIVVSRRRINTRLFARSIWITKM